MISSIVLSHPVQVPLVRSMAQTLMQGESGSVGSIRGFIAAVGDGRRQRNILRVGCCPSAQGSQAQRSLPAIPILAASKRSVKHSRRRRVRRLGDEPTMAPMIHPTGLRLGPIAMGWTHLCVDMQQLFAQGTRWSDPATAALVPAVLPLIDRAPDRTLFSRFLTPAQASDMPGQWQAYYRYWEDLRADQLPDKALDLLPELAARAAPDRTIDKYMHSAFESPSLTARLRTMATDTLILTGVETDVCVLATALGGIDRGFRVIVLADGVASSSPAGHEATLNAILPRFDQQAETVWMADLLAALP